VRATDIVGDVSLTAMVQRPDPARSPGLHLYDILQDINRALDPTRFSGTIAERPEFAVVGMAFEEMLGQTLRDLLPGWEKPGEFHADGIAMSPDGFGDPTYPGIDEVKATWKRCPDVAQDFCDEVKFSHYHRQAKSYCRVLGVQHARFRVLYVCGTYHPVLPLFKTYNVRYTADELETNWTMILQHATDMGVL
jgi:hypothetical protein